jgi:hypothetical protein
MQQGNSNAPQRQLNDYQKLSRSQTLNHLRTELTKATPGHRISQFFQKYIWSWIYNVVKSGFGPNHPYLEYPAGQTGVYTMTSSAELIGQASAEAPGHASAGYTTQANGQASAGSPTEPAREIKLAVVADWATNTVESFQVADKIRNHRPDYTIHLGDTYFVGTPDEVNNNFVAPGSPWVRGEQGSFAVLGNHEMYARGIAFFDLLLPSIGLKKNGEYQGQAAGFFSLENEHWRILGLDTGYHSTGIPIIEFLPFFSPDCHFDDKLVKWLTDTVKLNDPNDRRSLLILTHHQFITAFHESEYAKPAGQLAKLIGTQRSVLWLWGHEHRFSMFAKTPIDKTVNVSGRCIGHGGMPVELNSREFQLAAGKVGSEKLVMVDRRTALTLKEEPLGYNGYVVLRVKGPSLSIEYCDTHQDLVKETWEAGPNGPINGRIVCNPASGLSPQDGKTWQDAVK